LRESTICLFIESVSGLNVSLNPDLIDALVASTAAVVPTFLVLTSDSTFARLSIFYFEVLAYFDST